MKWWAVGLVREQCLHKAQGDKVRCKINLNLTLKCFALYHLKFELHLQMTKLDLKVLKMTSTGISQHICKWCKKYGWNWLILLYILLWGFPNGSVIMKQPVNAEDAGDMGSIPGSGRYPWRRAWQPTPVLLPENPMDKGAWWATFHGVAKS